MNCCFVRGSALVVVGLSGSWLYGQTIDGTLAAAAIAPAPVVTPAPPEPAYQPLSLGEKLARFGKQTFGPGSFASPLLTATYHQWRDDPAEWGQGSNGYARRYAAALATRTSKNAIAFGLGAMLHEDPRFFPSHQETISGRVKYALIHTFLARTDSGGQGIAWSRIGASFGSGFLGSAWYPGRLSDPQHALERSGIGLAGFVGMSLGAEFAPDLKRLLRRKLHRQN